jgi:hypothetical protein
VDAAAGVATSIVTPLHGIVVVTVTIRGVVTGEVVVKATVDVEEE